MGCTWPRTRQDGRRVLLWPLLPQIGPAGWLIYVEALCLLYSGALGILPDSIAINILAD